MSQVPDETRLGTIPFRLTSVEPFLDHHPQTGLLQSTC